MNKAKFYLIKSFTTQGVVYTVRRMPDGEWRCHCTGFMMHEGRVRRAGGIPMCDHIRKARHLKMKYHGRKRKSKSAST